MINLGNLEEENCEKEEIVKEPLDMLKMKIKIKKGNKRFGKKNKGEERKIKIFKVEKLKKKFL
ncbi:unnamed protein product [Meloidogyne enterolobii]|uniref:Uncharacterized protein n=1 Tax=Meloidogyne enterolobii TaxID=390850 RepID=A0ACB0ZRX4_MELEN